MRASPIQSDTKSSADLWISFRMPGFTKNSLLGCWIPALLSHYGINGQYDWYKAPRLPIQGLRMESGWLARCTVAITEKKGLPRRVCCALSARPPGYMPIPSDWSPAIVINAGDPIYKG